MEKISIVISCYNEEKSLPLFYYEMEKVRKQDFDENTEFEYILVDDGSTDDTLAVIKTLRQKDNKIKYISFSRNFGKEAAMLAGLETSTGDYVTLMDADLQDPPSLLKTMLSAIKEEGFDSVGTRRVTRKGEPAIRSFFARRFYKIINRISHVEMVDGARDYRLMTRQVVDAILSLKEYNRYSKGLFSFVGFKTKWIEYENVERVAGETKWSFWKLCKYALEGIIAFSTMPLVLSSFLGLFFCIIAFLAIIFIIAKTLIFGDPTSGWPSLVCIIVLVSGIQLFSMGIIGQYLSKTYLEVKQRPVYIVKEKNE
ncbi:MAG: glycosyltransferase family 2 protein [Clostridia bacterium]|nr:glycosyltransferase family 2 protein [Clostridia bacterium]